MQEHAIRRLESEQKAQELQEALEVANRERIRQQDELHRQQVRIHELSLRARLSGFSGSDNAGHDDAIRHKVGDEVARRRDGKSRMWSKARGNYLVGEEDSDRLDVSDQAMVFSASSQPMSVQ